MRVRCGVFAVSLAGLLSSHCGSTTPDAPNRPDSSILPETGTTKHDSGKDGSQKATPKDAQSRTDASPHDAGVDAPPVPCGSRTGMRGLTHRSVVVAGKTRTYLVYLPETPNPTAPMPFVFVFHGYTMSGQEMLNITRYTAIADAEGIGVAFPDGEGGPNALYPPWNVENPGQVVCGDGQLATATGDDFDFIDAMKADVAEDQCLDTSHIFSAGFSMGGYFTHHIGCYRSDMRGLAAHSGGTLADLDVCTTGHVPIIIFHGTADPVIDDACDDPTVTADVGFPASATLWAAKNGCANTYTTIPADPGADGGVSTSDSGAVDSGTSDASRADAGGSTGQCYLYDGCPADGQVELCTFNGMQHCWAGGSNQGDAGGSACPSYASATALQWSFFKKYAW